MKTTYGFSRRGPDRVAEELADVLCRKASFEFKALFDIVHANLRERNAAGGGEEMLRLRAYEKLQNLVRAGIVKKVGREYRGDRPALVRFLKTAAELNAKFQAGIQARTQSAAPVKTAFAPKKAAASKKPAAPKKAAAGREALSRKKAAASKKVPVRKKGRVR